MPRISYRDNFLLKIVILIDLHSILVQSYENAAIQILKIV
ncbi:hypothetical protein GS03_00987 [Flavobacterium sangjuense]|uniref:Uncharacterized protein n=1 Tax=Flavobacterium sangjuense TaxID=2518177 RepID=A0A4P7PSG6_9FLAO|nr:hypothetical protein GS03_00987 [Flavobacterium sangjuense]